MSRQLRFCMISIYYPPYGFGGDAICLQRLCAQLVQAGHEVDVIHCADSYHMFSPTAGAEAFPAGRGITVHKLESGVGVLSPLLSHQTGLPVLTRRKIAAVLAGKRFDVIHYHNISLFGPGVLAIDPPHPAVRLYTAHEHWLVCPMNVLWKNNTHACDRPTCISCTVRSGRPPQWWRYTNMLEHAARHVDLFLAPSRSCRETHRKRGFPMEMSVLPCFVPEPAPRAAGDAVAPHPRPYFLFVGRLEKIKGVQEILHHFRGDGNYDLVIVGGGMYQDQLRRMAKGMSRVRFTGWLNQDEIAGYYRHSLAVVVPSITCETFEIVVIEAFACKKPVVVHDLGALPELVGESRGGFTYRTQDELRAHLDRLAGDENLRRELGERGYRAFREKWSPEPHLRLYHDYIRSVQERKFGSGSAPA